MVLKNYKNTIKALFFIMEQLYFLIISCKHPNSFLIIRDQPSKDAKETWKENTQMVIKMKGFTS